MNETEIKEIVKKTDMVARDRFSYEWITYPEKDFLVSHIVEKSQELEITYELADGTTALTEIRNEDIQDILLILESIGHLRKYINKYDFALQPDNLYYDMHKCVKAKRRDCASLGSGDEESFITAYKAIAGYALQIKYSFSDLLQGGLHLIEQEGILGDIIQASTVEDIQYILCGQYEQLKNDRLLHKTLVPTKRLHKLKRMLVVVSLTAIICGGFILYDHVFHKPVREAEIAVSKAYIRSDYAGCIDSMKSIRPEDMPVEMKFMLANAYVQCENLSREQKNNILDKMTLHDTQMKLDYWIEIGRRHTEKAADIAIRLSDDQLLLYAYMQERSIVEENSDMSGNDKTTALKEIDDKLEPLIKKYKDDVNNSESIRGQDEKQENKIK